MWVLENDPLEYMIHRLYVFIYEYKLYYGLISQTLLLKVQAEKQDFS